MNNQIKHAKGDRILLLTNNILLTIIILAIVGPLLYVFLSSFLEPNAIIRKGLSLHSSDWSLEGYKRLFTDDTIVRGFFNSLLYSTGFTIVTVLVCLFAGYTLSVDGLVGKKVFMIFFLFTMFFGGGLIPTYFVIRDLGMLNTIWAIILPGAVNVWFIILARTYFKAVPNELKEAARIDGASDLKIFFRIILPLSKPIIFVLALYAFIGQWNAYFDAMIYLDDRELHPLQLVLRSILIQNEVQPGMVADVEARNELMRISEMIRYSSIVIASLPLLIMYPFFQKYFEKGVMVGSLK
ncbi:carbohydrate ABC transporter permease [Neobacillus sp. YX16]|jgi:putative aldouronate transport system permease protein|uniref:carbohydrate ABC transporter permease n=1 Tax=Bacillaceae TaxID=186817 RepID=UPI000BA70775|nr:MULTISPECIES: carbohydrate ABC transporter permease [Bacillaceae]PAE44623.1 sugar ABC transporter permease [Bacillus sp. 7884-1]WHZ02521.1 carbohydrate ABC transporter permease [Neobacillus sp. YX16]